MRANTVRTRIWLGVGVAAVATVVATSASGVTGRDKITTIAGGLHGFSGDGGAAIRARFGGVTAVAVDGRNNIYVADRGSARVRRISPAGIITTIAGSGKPGFAAFSGDGGPATSARLSTPEDVAVDGQGNLYIADRGNNRVRKVSPDGIITTIAGMGECRSNVSGDGGPATAAPLCLPVAVAVDVQRNVFIAEFGGGGAHRVRKVSPDGIITTVAGTGERGFSGDGGPATSARLNFPAGLAVDAKGNLYIVDFQNARVRKVTPAGRITTFAGSGKYEFSGDGGPATKAGLLFRTGVHHEGLAVDRQGNVYIADGGNYRVRKVTRGGTITTIAGAGLNGGGNHPPNFTGDGGPAAMARLWGPAGVAVDSRGNVLIADESGGGSRTLGSSIRKVTVRP